MVEKLDPVRHAYLTGILRKLRRSYVALMRRCQGLCHLHLSREYHRDVRLLGITSQFEEWQKHPTTWQSPVDAKTARVATIM